MLLKLFANHGLNIFNHVKIMLEECSLLVDKSLQRKAFLLSLFWHSFIVDD